MCYKIFLILNLTLRNVSIEVILDNFLITNGAISVILTRSKSSYDCGLWKQQIIAAT